MPEMPRNAEMSSRDRARGVEAQEPLQGLLLMLPITNKAQGHGVIIYFAK